MLYYVLCVHGHGCVISRGSYGPKVGIPFIFLTIFYEFIDLGVSNQGTDMALRGHFLKTFLAMFDALNNIDVSAQGSDM